MKYRILKIWSIAMRSWTGQHALRVSIEMEITSLKPTLQSFAFFIHKFSSPPGGHPCIFPRASSHCHLLCLSSLAEVHYLPDLTRESSSPRFVSQFHGFGTIRQSQQLRCR